ncbi:MAG: hypothetical protein M1134_06890 [Actinobacteria bacterium]|nr:hypothetical protein [Actinomycetota bacterium]MCL5444635.1 hypothetical protein [Actinomycetota bacterium]
MAVGGAGSSDSSGPHVRVERALVVGGYLLITADAAIAVLASYTVIPTFNDGHLYEVGRFISEAVVVAAWWSIVPVLQRANARRHLRRPLWMFAAANVLLAAGYACVVVGEVGSGAPLVQRYALSGYWAVTIVGLCAAAVGFIKISLGQSIPLDDAVGSREPLVEGEASPKTMRPKLRTPRMLVLAGYAALAVATVADMWPTEASDLEGWLFLEVAVLVSWGMIGWAWWSSIEGLGASLPAKDRLRVSFRYFAIASGVMAVVNMVFIPTAASPFPGWSNVGVLTNCVIDAVGYVMVAVGFWRASGVVGGHGTASIQGKVDQRDLASSS